MKYMSFIFENQDIRNTVANSEALVELAAANIINTNLVIEAYIYENLVDFTAGTETAHQVYENIRDFVISENSIAYTQLSEILADREISEEDKIACLSENAAMEMLTKAGSAIKQTAGTAMHAGRQAADSLVRGAKELAVGHAAAKGTIAGGWKPALAETGGLLGKAGELTAGRSAASAATVGLGAGAGIAASMPDSPSGENMASALDTVKGLANAHPYTAAAIGATGAGLGAYGIYKAMKAKKPS